MANEISSMTMANLPRSPAKDSSQIAKPEMVPVPESGQSLPSEGKALPPKVADLNQGQLQEAVKQINDYVQSVQRDLTFSMDGESGRTVIRVIDSGSGELIRQIPSEEVLALASYLQDLGATGSMSPGVVKSGILFSEST